MSEFELYSFSSEIILSTLNARYSHASLGLRYLLANMGELKSQTVIREFTIQQSVDEVVEALVAQQPKIIGFGVYIWTVELLTQVVQQLKALRPEIKIILGGPEVSYEYEEMPIVQAADYLITGWGDSTFPWLCAQLVKGKRPLTKVLVGQQPPLEDIVFPYDEYTAHDLTTRTVYVEASRGCPYKCEICLSSLDKTAWSFPLEPFLAHMKRLYRQGLRQFKFVDRTFNLKKEFTSRILSFFLDKIKAYPEESLFLHFELVPDHLPDELKMWVQQFPPGCLQFEIGIQTLNPETQVLISRKTNLIKAKENIQWLRTNTHVHMHVDLIAGLPAENLTQFAEGFNELYTWGAHEIQLGVLKRLRGAPISRHTEAYGYIYSPLAPYSVLQNNDLSYELLNEIKRIAKYWEKMINSGRFRNTQPLLLGAFAFEDMRAFSAWLYQKSGQTHSMALDRLFAYLFEYLVEHKGCDRDLVRQTMIADFSVTGIQGWPKYLGDPPEDWAPRRVAAKPRVATPKRQQRHTY